MLKEFPIKFDKSQVSVTPAANDLLDIGKGEELDDEKREIFHSFVAKGLFLKQKSQIGHGSNYFCTCNKSTKTQR